MSILYLLKNRTNFIILLLVAVTFSVIITLDNAYAETVTVDQCPGSSNAENDCFFVLKEVTIKKGDTVIWTNSDSATHTVTSGDVDDPDTWGRIFDSGLAKPGSTFEFTFDTADEYPYLCQLHPWMVGKVTVTDVPKIVLQTDNGSVNVELSMDKGIIDDKSLTIDPPQPVRFDLRFLDPATGQPLQHVNYNFMITDEKGNTVMNSAAMHTHEGVDVQSVQFSNTGSFTLAIDIAGLGINKPYDTKHSGMANTSLTVVPEFPLSGLVIMTAVVGMGIAATRFKNPLL